MEFKESLTTYLVEEEEEEDDLNTRCSFDFKRFKHQLNFCRQHRHDEASIDSHGDVNLVDDRNQSVPNQHCNRCDRMFSELTLATSKMADNISLKVEHLVRLHFTSGLPRFLSCMLQCFKDDQEQLMSKGLMLIQFVVMNAIALRKILKKYDKAHESAKGMNFKSKLQARHLDIMLSPWLIELVALCININGSDSLVADDLFGQLSFNLKLTGESSVLTLILLDSEKLDCSLICPICLDLFFQPYALRCGHIFCKSCACLAARVLIIEGLKYASSDSKCPVCRESGVYDQSVCMSELGLLLQQRCKQKFRERLMEERKIILKQTKEYWELQTSHLIGL
ncbi:putative E3 ubiquitin-protein ligase BAH1-like 1 [Bidens hawaiensis]|uniref:putative E3 ubiquitin-protein ligase BAH1-like 1 n=1 Tax=Bidens hawaiensis TaxID=980011 RepID=UPI00404B6068